MTHERQFEPGKYRFLYLDLDDIAGGRFELITASDDANALKLAWTRMDGFESVPIEISEGNRLVGHIDPPVWKT